LLAVCWCWRLVQQRVRRPLTDASSSLDVSSMKWIESTMDLLVTIAILFECKTKEFQFPWETFLVTHDSRSVYQGHWMLTDGVVVWLNIQMQVGVGEFHVHSVPQGAIWSSVNVSIQENKGGTQVSMVNWMLRCLRKFFSSPGQWGQIMNVPST
jgi:hypothetical protein